MHFYESSIITTKDGLHCQVYGNEHPLGLILVKPKYIPTDKIECNSLQYRFISGKKMNRLNLWIDKNELKKYIEEFKINYPHYILMSSLHSSDRLFFSVPIDNIERVYFPKRGIKELMNMPVEALDSHLKTVHDFVEFIVKCGLSLDDLGITYSTLMGHYLSSISDINIVVYGKKNFWKLMKYLETAAHPLIRWKTKGDWLRFYNDRNRFKIFTEDEFIRAMSRKKSEGYFNGILFIIFCAENENEVWFRWGEETYTSLGHVTIQGTVVDNFSSVARPGCYNIADSVIIETDENLSHLKDSVQNNITKIVFYSRDYCMLADNGERVRASGILEKVDNKNGASYYRLVIGYFDAYISERREKEYIKVVKNG